MTSRFNKCLPIFLVGAETREGPGIRAEMKGARGIKIHIGIGRGPQIIYYP